MVVFEEEDENERRRRRTFLTSICNPTKYYACPFYASNVSNPYLKPKLFLLSTPFKKILILSLI